jgi:urease accessory protein
MSISSRLGVALVLLIPAVAFAHPGHDFGATMLAGLLHPLTGLDHILAMIGTGIWAVHSSKRGAAMLPFAFASGMLIGAALMAFGISLPAIEPLIAVSVVVLGALIAARVRVHDSLSAGLVGCFAIFHGYAHGAEAGVLQIPFASGFVVATICLSLLGVWLGKRILISSHVNASRVFGSIIGATGALLMIGV